MPEWLNALILGVIQGLTEFLPVSSSGHLELVKFLLDYDAEASESLLLTITLHAATALATLFVLRNLVFKLLKSLLEGPKGEGWHYAIKIVISMIPAAIVGFLWESDLEALFQGRISFVSAMLIVTGIILILANRTGQGTNNVTPKNSFIIGLAQAFALLPGISRSGSTIGASLLLGIERKQAAEFSFLMVVPLILGKMAYELLDGELSATSTGNLSLLVGFLAAFVVGAISCKWMISIVRKSKLIYFGIYCILIGSIFLIMGLVA